MSFDSNIEPTLFALGFDEFFQTRLSSQTALDQVARVAVEHRGRYVVLSPRGACDALMTGRLRHEAGDAIDLPRVGDWVELGAGSNGDLALIERVLPRKTLFARRAAGDSRRPQVIAANVDVVLIVSSMSASDDHRVQRRGINLRRLERYFAAVSASGARAVFVLNKTDLALEHDRFVASVHEIAAGAPVIATSAITGDGLVSLRAGFSPGETLALVGSSGVGKTALTNRLLGFEAERLGVVRDKDERGRHTTTHRELFLLPGGGALIDTPGMRELGLWDASDVDSGFDEIARFADTCRFRDCRHAGEPGCAVWEAIDRGDLDKQRLFSQQKLARELAFERRKTDPMARSRAQRELRRRARAYRQRDKLGK